MKNVLYISILGMSEPLGKSQVLEYLQDLSKEYNITLYSFEKDLTEDTILELSKKMDAENIDWHYQRYSNKYGIFSTIYQIASSQVKLRSLLKTKNINVIHARSLIPAMIGALLRSKNNKLLFDIRAFQIDEKTEAGRIQIGSVLYKVLKYIENLIYKKSDHIVTLTKASSDVLTKELGVDSEKITVIPTCVSKSVFKILEPHEKLKLKRELGYQEDDKIIIHVGDVRERYDFDCEVKLFKKVVSKNQNFRFLVINRGSEHEYIKGFFKQHLIDENYYKILSSEFYDVYKYLNIADVSLFLINNTYSRVAMSPTKFAENLACHIPSFTNLYVGDMEEFFRDYDVGKIVDLSHKDKEIKNWAKELISLAYNFKTTTSFDTFDKLLENNFSKSIAVRKYSDIYQKLSK